LREQIENATTLVNAAAFKYRMANMIQAADLHLEAERACAGIIKAIGDLPEAEADLVEPMFTEFEQQLLTLPRLRSHLSPGYLQ
jgi:hypothetical protein